MLHWTFLVWCNLVCIDVRWICEWKCRIVRGFDGIRFVDSWDWNLLDIWCWSTYDIPLTSLSSNSTNRRSTASMLGEDSWRCLERLSSRWTFGLVCLKGVMVGEWKSEWKECALKDEWLGGRLVVNWECGERGCWVACCGFSLEWNIESLFKVYRRVNKWTIDQPFNSINFTSSNLSSTHPFISNPQLLTSNHSSKHYIF